MNLLDLARPEIRALAPYASARALADSAGILLNANENPYPPPGDSGQDLNRYPDPQPAALKSRLAALYGIDADQLLLTRGSDEGIDLLMRAFVRAGQDRVLTCPPCFGMYALSARIQGGEVIEVPLIETESDWQLDVEGIQAAPACRLYFLCSPNNPTGNRIPTSQVLDLAERVSGHGLVIIDEAYIEFSADESLAGQVGSVPNLVVLRTLSKAYALAGCRLGAVIGSAELIGLLRRIIAPYPLPTPSIQAALQALDAPNDQRHQLEELDRQKQRLVLVLKDHPAIERIWPGAANFILVRTRPGSALVSAAADAGIRLRDQSAQPGLNDCVRITVGRPEETDHLIQFLRSWSP
ncbi:MAG: histidinol-phosphate transaminase [Wenzhouxiangella sp.]|nr:MAG: histidinol-phosphate transaminase [Wenzhouxiangella sp.]